MKTIIGMAGKRRRITPINSNPDIRGISSSEIISLGRVPRSFTIASIPFSALITL